jgi:hypothetical protein
MVDVVIFLVYVSYGHLVYFVAIWNILLSFGIFFPVFVCFTKKNLATLLKSSEMLAYDEQGGQIGCFFALSVVVNFWDFFFENCIKRNKVEQQFSSS